MNPRRNLINALALVYDALATLGYATKTVAYYERVLRGAVLNFYRGSIGSGEFIGIMIDLIEGQFRRAWNEGMRAVGLEPTTDMLPEWELTLKKRINQEFEHVLDFAQAVQDAKDKQTPIDLLYSRVYLWANRYNEVMALAQTTCGGKVKLQWILGATERHCSTCSRLNGVVAYSFEWEAAGLHPQGAPNPRLECGGWRCDCRLVPTRRYRTRGGIPPV